MTEDAFGAPPAARGSMMKVSGAEDKLEPGEELLVDDPEEAAGPTEDASQTMKGPVYPEHKIRITLGDLKRLVQEQVDADEDR